MRGMSGPSSATAENGSPSGSLPVLTLEREFTLTDRSKFEYPVLVGRNIINGIAAVDPSRRNVL